MNKGVLSDDFVNQSIGLKNFDKARKCILQHAIVKESIINDEIIFIE